MKYKCLKCKYTTTDKSNYNKHIKTDNHLSNSDDNTMLIQIDSPCNKSTQISVELPLNSTEKKDKDKKDTKQLECNFCNKTFSRSDALKRHLDDYCKIKNEKEKEEIYQKLLIDMEKKLDELKKEEILNYKLKVDELKKEEILNYKLKVNELEKKHALEKAKIFEDQLKEFKKYTEGWMKIKPSNTTYNISVKNYVQKNYANAPALKKLDDYDFIKYDDKLLDTIGYQYRNKILDKYLGDFLIGFYKKEEPSKQSIWNSDVSRLTYVIKELLANNKSCWNTDPRGVKTKNYIINPLLIFLKNIINDYSINFTNTILDKNIDEITQLLDNLHSLTLLVKDINNNLMSDDIVKYIAPYFSLDKIPELLEK